VQGQRDLPKEANKAKCFVIACFVFSLFSMIGFAGGLPGIVGALCGLLACVASSILMCCAPKSTAEGGGKFMAAGVMLLIAGIMQLVMGIVVIVQMIVILNEVAKGWCDDYYKTCTTDCAGNSCSDKSGAGSIYWDTTSDSVCNRATTTSPYSCSRKTDWESCEALHGGVKAAVTGIVVALFGIAAAFLIVAGLLNTIGGGYCLKAKTALAAPKAISPA